MASSSSRIVLHCLAVMAVVAVGQCGDSPLLPPGGSHWPISSYVAKYYTTNEDRLAFEYVKDLIKDMNLSSPEEVKQYLEELKLLGLDGMKQRFPYARDLIVELVNLADNSTTTPSKETLRAVVDLIENVYGGLEVMEGSSPGAHYDVALYNFLKHYSKIKFDINAEDVLARYERELAELQPDVEAQFDNLIGCHDTAGYGSSQGEKDQFLSHLAERMDLYRGHFDAKCMTKMARGMSKEISPNPEGYGKLDWLMSVDCQGLSHWFEQILLDYNMMRVFNPETFKQVSAPARLVKLNEYTRLCNQLTAPNTRQQVLDKLRSHEYAGLIGKAINLISW